jgi:hypothetical protein
MTTSVAEVVSSPLSQSWYSVRIADSVQITAGVLLSPVAPSRADLDDEPEPDSDNVLAERTSHRQHDPNTDFRRTVSIADRSNAGKSPCSVGRSNGRAKADTLFWAVFCHAIAPPRALPRGN